MNDEEMEVINFKSILPVDAPTGMATQNTMMLPFALEHPKWGQGIALAIAELDIANGADATTLAGSGIPMNSRLVLTFPKTVDLKKNQVVDNSATCKAAEQIIVDNNITVIMPNKESFVYDQIITCIADGYWGLVGARPSNEFAEEFGAQYELMGM